MRRKNDNGFSLIELSIVLIIIGLLVAGVTGGASLIKSARVRSIISEANEYNVAINSFYISEGGLPGDSTIGNNNGKIEYFNGTKTETIQAWKDMSNKGLINTIASINTFNFSIIGNAIAGDIGLPPLIEYPHLDSENAPTSKYGGVLWGIETYSDFKKSVFFLSGPISYIYENSAVIVPIFEPSIAKSIDLKMDDGIPDKGAVRGVGSSSSSSGCYESNEYLKDVPGNLCGLILNIMVR